MQISKMAVSAVALVFSLAALSSAAVAKRQRNYEPGGEYVTAESKYGNGSVTGAVRMTDLGPQVQLPGGHWEYCRRSCSETLRVQSIDFNNRDDVDFGGKGTLGNECGIFGCLEIGIGRRGR